MTVSDSPHDHEREALAWLRSRLPDREPYHVWTNFEFTSGNGQLYEVDALAITDNGVHLIEIKGYSGRIDGDGATWRWTSPDGKFRQLDNPRLLANRKAKALKSLIESSAAFKGHRRDVPYVAECVFLSDRKLTSGLSPQGRFEVFGRDGATRDEPLPPERAALGGIVDHLVSLAPDAKGRQRHRVQRSVVDRLVKAVDQIGIRERSSRREIGDYKVGRLLHDVEATSTNGVTYQDFEGTHRSLDVVRRLRLYPLELNATAEQREAAQRAARREFNLLDRLDHSGIVKPVGYTDHERGPVLVFDFDPNEVTLAEFMANPLAATMSVQERLELLRQVAEALAYAQGQGVFHRALCPSAVLVRPARAPGESPRARVANWHTGARIADDATSTLLTGTAHVHVEALSALDAELYRAPEFQQARARPAPLDVFSLGALAVFVLTGRPPAASTRQLREVLQTVGYLDPSSVADGVDPNLAQVIIEATAADPVRRPPTVDEFLTYLDVVEEDWNARDTAEADNEPLDARRGDTLLDDRFEVLQRLGKGSTSVALLVRDRQAHKRLCVLKFAENPDHNDRILDEAASLDGIVHPNIVSLLGDPFDLGAHTAMLITYAGPKVDADRTDLGEGRTLASRLSSGPVGVELAQRWGEDLLHALQYLEEMGRAHRDIKPENLGVAPRGSQDALHLVLFDFSLSSAPVDRIEAGTPGYIDPFLERRKRWDPAADRYAATVTLFQLTTGMKPRYGDGRADPTMVDSGPTVEASMFDSAAAPGLVTFFTKALQPDVADRFGRAEEMYWAWHEAFAAASRPATPSSHPDDDEFSVPGGTTLSTPLAGLPLTKRAVSALEHADVVTVGQLIDLPAMRLNSQPGVGAKTRGEIREAADALRAHFAPIAQPAVPTPTSPHGVGEGDATQSNHVADTGDVAGDRGSRPPTPGEPESTDNTQTQTDTTNLGATDPTDTDPTGTAPADNGETVPHGSSPAEDRELGPSRAGPSGTTGAGQSAQHGTAALGGRHTSTEPSRTEPSRTEPSRTEPGRTEPSRTEPSRTEPSRTEHSWIESVAHAAAPAARTSDLETRARLARILAGLEPDRNPWASQSELAAWLGVTPARVSQIVTALRKSWLKQSLITQVRDIVRTEVGNTQVASVAQIAARLAAHAPAAGGPHDGVIANGVLRVATLTEEAITSPGWIQRRRHGTVLLATQLDDDAGAERAQQLADYAVAVAAATAALIEHHEVVAQRELLDHLRQVPAPAGTTPLADAHLADLAADLCPDAAVNNRVELYRVGLAPDAALRAARRAFVADKELTVDQVAAKVKSRFPLAAPLPHRPQLDTVLAEAGIDLRWSDADAKYLNPQHDERPSTMYSRSISRHATAVPANIPAVEIDAAADFEQRLIAAGTGNALLVLVTQRAELAKAEAQLQRLAATTVDFDAALIGELESITAGGKPSWATLAAADSAGELGPQWARLRTVVEQAVGRVTARMAATAGTVLLTNAGLLARYDRLGVLAEWRDLLHRNTTLADGPTLISALWLLVPSSTAADVPMLDGRAVPVISRNEWSHIPAEWLANAHRTGVSS